MDLRQSKIKVSRRLGIAITPKSARFMERRPNPPGQHGAKANRKLSNFGLQLVEKQKLRAQYNISERQMQIAMAEALRKKGSTIDNLLQYLETRLDVAVLRSGFARTIFAARQFVSHGHVLVNEKKVNIASYRIKIGDTITIKEASRKMPVFEEWTKFRDMPSVAPYFETAANTFTSTLKYLPGRNEVPVDCNVQSVIEFYSR